MDRWMKKTGKLGIFVITMLLLMGSSAYSEAQPEPTMPAEHTSATEHHPGGEANLELPDLGQTEVGGYSAVGLLSGGLGVSLLGMLFFKLNTFADLLKYFQNPLEISLSLTKIDKSNLAIKNYPWNRCAITFFENKYIFFIK